MPICSIPRFTSWCELRSPFSSRYWYCLIHLHHDACWLCRLNVHMKLAKSWLLDFIRNRTMIMNLTLKFGCFLAIHKPIYQDCSIRRTYGHSTYLSSRLLMHCLLLYSCSSLHPSSKRATFYLSHYFMGIFLNCEAHSLQMLFARAHQVWYCFVWLRYWLNSMYLLVILVHLGYYIVEPMTLNQNFYLLSSYVSYKIS